MVVGTAGQTSPLGSTPTKARGTRWSTIFRCRMKPAAAPEAAKGRISWLALMVAAFSSSGPANNLNLSVKEPTQGVVQYLERGPGDGDLLSENLPSTPRVQAGAAFFKSPESSN